MIRVGLLSFWHVHAPEYARYAAENPNTQIVAVWDEQPERGQAEAGKRNARFYNTLDELLASDVDAVVVDTPTSMHRDVMVAAAQAGKHIFTEKVLAPTLRECNEIVAAVDQASVKLLVSLRRYYAGYTKAIKQILDQGQLGDVTLVRIRDAHNGAVPTAQNPKGWLVDHFFNKAETHGGAMIDLGCHPMYLTRYFAGMPESVSATYGYHTRREVEDNAVVTLSYPEGRIGVVETGFVSSYSPFTIEICGTEGSLIYGIPQGRLQMKSNKTGGREEPWTIQDDVPGDRGPAAFEEWIGLIQNDTTAPENRQLALDLSALMEAANLSAENGRAVRLDSLAQ
jgi:predicted dehydrogenase